MVSKELEESFPLNDPLRKNKQIRKPSGLLTSVMDGLYNDYHVYLLLSLVGMADLSK